MENNDNPLYAEALIAAYTLIREAVPLAISAINIGQGSNLEHYEFWRAINDVEAHVELFDWEQAAENGKLNIYDDGNSCISAHILKLIKLCQIQKA